MFLSDVQARHDRTVEMVELMLELRQFLPGTSRIGLKHGRV